MQTAIVGAGLTGLTLARLLKPHWPEAPVVFEKSRGVGGRMATRRIGTTRFDHGAQFYTLRAPIENWHQDWLTKSLVQKWFDADDVAHFICPAGMTSLAKDLASEIEVKLNTRVTKISRTERGWCLVCDDVTEFETKQLILTAPLPQSLELLKKSGIDCDSRLESVRYASAVVALIEVEEMTPRLAGPQGYREVEGGLIFTIVDQVAKGLATRLTLVVTLRPEASHDCFANDDAKIGDVIVDELQMLDPSFVASSVQIKKWRYSHPFETFPELYFSPAEGLFLAGDAFGGPSLNGAVRSANALADWMISSHSHSPSERTTL